MKAIEVIIFFWLLIVAVVPLYSHIVQIKRKELTERDKIVDRFFIITAFTVFSLYCILLAWL